MKNPRASSFALFLQLLQFSAGIQFCLASDQVLLRPDPSGPAAVASILTFAGRIEAWTHEVVPAREISIALLADTLTREDLDLLKSGVGSLLQRLKGARPVSVVLINGTECSRLGPFKTRAQLPAVLRSPGMKIPESGSTGTSADLYSNLLDAIPQLGSDWSPVLLAGRFPPITSDRKAYLEALLAVRACSQKIRLRYWNLANAPIEPLDAALRSTGGLAPAGGISEFGDDLFKEPQSFTLVEWDAPQLSAGFHLYRAVLFDHAGNEIMKVPALAGVPGLELPYAEQYEGLRAHVREIERLLSEPVASEPQLAEIRKNLERALLINPRDRDALRLGADFLKHRGDYANASHLLGSLSELQPADGKLLSEWGHTLYLASSPVEAESILLRAGSLRPGDAGVAEDLGRIRAERHDFAGALPFLEESLKSDPSNRYLWFVRADVSLRLGDWRRAADSYEHGLGLEPDHLPERTQLVRLYLAHDLPENALKQVRMALPALPEEADACATFAGFLERLGQEGDALRLWRKTLELDPRREEAHYGATRILLDQGDFAGAAGAADAGLEAAPRSARLFLSKTLALEKQNLWYEARRTIAKGAAAIEDVRLFRHAAESEDQYGQSAVQSYMALSSFLGRSPDDSKEYIAALKRGLDVSLRAGDMGAAGWFEGKLEAAGQGEPSLLSNVRKENPGKGILVRGGMKALLMVIQGREQTAAESFFADYCRAIVSVVSMTSTRVARANLDLISEYFARVSALEGLGQRNGNRVTVTLAVNDKPARQAAETILHLIGWDIRYTKKGIVVEAAEEGPASRNQFVAPALGIDQLAMQEALQAGREFNFEIVDESALIPFDESLWRTQFLPKNDLPGGIAEAMERDPQIARLYLGLTALDAATAAALVDAIGLRELAQKYADLLLAYSSSLATGKGKAALPGGEQAEAIWERLTGASPRNPGQFFKALLKKDEGKMLAFFYALTEQDMPHQRFFTSSAGRTAGFYDLFKEAPDVQHGANRDWRATPFIDFLAGVPLDDSGHVRFPGSPEVWMLARGHSSSPSNTARLLKRLPKTAAPELEDEILLRLARTSYKVGGLPRSELTNFLAVVHLEAHRTEPLSEEAALVLAQEYPEYAQVWPYFAVLTGLGQKEYARFFALGEKLRQLDDVGLNRVLGQLHALIKLICMAKQAGSLDERQSADLFFALCERFGAAAVSRDYTVASLELVRMLIGRALPDEASGDPDAALAKILLGRAEPVSLELKGTAFELNGGKARYDNYRRVLALQRVPALHVLLELYDTARALAGAGENPAEKVAALEKIAPSIPGFEIPGSLRISGKEMDSLESFQPGKIVEAISRLREVANKRKLNPKDLEKPVNELLGAINPQVELALAGPIYARYLSPSDLLISEDPLFLRRHHYLDLESATRKSHIFAEPELIQRQVEGSYLRGGFADFAAEAGKTALAGSRMADTKGFSFIATQIGLLRATRWDLLQDDDLRLVGLKVRAAREWVVQAARNPALMSGLADASCGILSLTRRAGLMRSLESKDWAGIWQNVTLSDLFFLSDEYLRRYQTDPWDSPTMKALRNLAARQDGARLQWLGPVLSSIYNCSHPHLLRLPPYEHFEKFLMTDKLAVRAGEFKLYISEYLDRMGLPAGALEAIAEPLATEILRDVRLTDPRDWHAFLAAYSGLNDNQIRAVLSKQ